MKKYRLIYILLITLLALSACTPAYTEQPSSIETIVAATYAVIQAQTAAAMPTATIIPLTPIKPYATTTPIPTSTSFVISSFTPTSTITATPVYTATNVTSGSGTVLYACDILSTSPENGFEVKPNKEFVWIWNVKNIGTVRWAQEKVTARYSNGAEYYVKKEVGIQEPVNLGQTGEFRIKLKAPSAPGTHTTTWSMRKGIHYFCYVQLKIVVKK